MVYVMILVCVNIMEVDNSWNKWRKHLPVLSIVFSGIGKIKTSFYRIVWKCYFLYLFIVLFKTAEHIFTNEWIKAKL